MKSVVNIEKWTPKSSFSYLTFKGSTLETISLKVIKRSSKDVPSNIHRGYSRFKCNLLVALFILHNCSSFNHRATGILSFKISCRIEFDICEWIWERAFDSYIVFLPTSWWGYLIKPEQCIIQIHLSEITCILTCYTKNLMLQSNNRISHFNVNILKSRCSNTIFYKNWAKDK